MKYGLSEEQLKQILDIIASYDEIEEAILFGSRAIDTYKEASDVDIAIKGKKVTATLAAKLKYHFEEDTYLPYFFDFVAYPTITNETLKQHIDSKGISIYRAGWKECKLGDVVVSANTGLDAIKRAPIINYDSGIKCLRIQDVSQSKKYEDWGFTEVEDRNYQKFQLKMNEILIARTGASIGVNQLIKKDIKAVFNNGLIRLRTKEEVCDPKYLFYNLCTTDYKGFIESISGGTSTQPNMQINALLRFDLLLPSLPEQKAIASILSSFDDKIDLLHRQNKTLEAMAETLFRQWFVEEALEDWLTVRVGDFVKTNILSINKDYKLKTIRYLDTGSLTEGKIDGYQTFDIADVPSRARRIVKHNDVLFSTVRPNQKHYGILKHPTEDIIVSTGFCVITCDKINPHFIYILLTMEEMTEYLHSIAEGSTSTYPSLKPSDIENLGFQLPPVEKLKAFSEYANNAWGKIDYNHIQIRTLEKIRDTLLPKLMSGEVRVR